MNKLILVGNSNVGKSSITKFLIGDTRAKKLNFKGKTGKTPGTTLTIRPIELGEDRFEVPMELVDLPGFGFMKGTSKTRGDQIKDRIVHYIEENKTDICLGIVVINLEAFPRIIQKWESVQIPLDLEFIQFLAELDIPTIIIANKIDKLPPRKIQSALELLKKKIREYLNSLPDFEIPHVIPVSMKTSEGTATMFEQIRRAVRKYAKK